MPDTQPEAKPKSGWWIALTNLSRGRSASSPDKQADLITKGEKVELTEDESHGFLTRHRRPVVRPFDEKNDKDANLTARDLFGQRPPAEAFGARPDPPGASTVTVNDEIKDPADPRNAPEAKDPVTDFSVDPAAAKDKGTGVKPK
jgi:hypothetical protein